MKLYEISNLLTETIAEYENCVDSTGEVIENTDELDARLEALQGHLTDKLVNVALFIKNEAADADSIKEEIDKLKKREASHRNRVNRLSGLIERYAGGETIIDPRCEIKWRKSEAVEVDDIDKLPFEFIKTKREPIKVEIKKALQAGIDVQGARIITKQNLQIK